MKKRIIPIMLMGSGGQIVTSKKFNPWRTVGVIMQSLRLHDSRGADEIIILDVNASKSANSIDLRLLHKISQNLKIPLTVGGGISTLDIARDYISSGADKVSLCSACIDNLSLVESISESLGAQAVVGSLNISFIDDVAFLYDYRTSSSLDIKLTDHIPKLIKAGVGEIMITSVDKDGSLSGFDLRILNLLDLIKPSVPVIIAGGGGSPEHFVEVLKHDYLMAAAGGSIFAFTENTPSTLRKFCLNSCISMKRH
ncbi:HisA/HisF-related TIM barrel protein [Polynucleobacter alcilacus]|uniref:HisA/HisF-related TIM barrel protein n=1 Tax=Polynucleobacter alcilacus TaxID=1819739 RepID=UPI001C0B8E0A|nr:HisA/HisF-related TIM barrel protein [Polynucleobacter alcilacus]MBU3568183.1 hypothetical protein [Polynucleobacter alcilacus]